MENNEFRLSINAKTIILILLLLNVGYAYKKIKQYHYIKETGYIRERTVKDQIRKRIMKSFGSVEEMDNLVVDFADQKADIEKLASTVREQDKRLSKAYKDLEDAKLKNREQKDYLQQKIRGMAAYGFSKRKDRYEQMGKLSRELKERKAKFEEEKALLQEKIRDLEESLSKSRGQ